MQDYGVREAAQILGLPERTIRRYVQDGLLDTRRGPRNEYRFGFQELVLLRTAKALLTADVSPRRIQRALAALRRDLPEGQPLSGVHLGLEGEDLVVRDGLGAWLADSGQRLLDFSSRNAAPVAPLEPAPLEMALDVDLDELATDFGTSPTTAIDPEDQAAEMHCADWLELADAFDDDRRPIQARDALRRALECDPFDAEARRRLGRLLEQDGRLELAEAQYRLTRRLHPRDPEVALDHGRLLAQMGELERALEAFEVARVEEPELEPGYLGAADIFDRLGRHADADRLREQVQALRSGGEGDN